MTFPPLLTSSQRRAWFCVTAAVMSLLPAPLWAHGKGLYKTESEAQARAQELGCKTVHQNNGRWMPCSDEAELHRMLRKE